MPTLSADTQAVLATDKVRFQGQEVAFVVAEDRYAARDALELIDVDYEPLPAVVDAAPALDPDAPVIRDDIEGNTDNHIFDWEAGDAAATDARVRATPTSSWRQDMLYPRVHPAPLETCGAVADMDPVDRQADDLDARPRRRTRTARSTRWSPGMPEHKIRIIAPDIGGGFGNKVGIYPGYVLRRSSARSSPASPVKWMEDRSENLDLDRRSPATTTCTARSRRRATGKILGAARRRARRPRRVQRHRAADEVPGRVLPHLHRLLRPARRRTARSPASTRTRRPAAWPTPARSA